MNSINNPVTLLSVLLLTIAASCTGREATEESDKDTDTITEMTTTNRPDTTTAKVRIETTLGSFTVLLYGDTPKHRDNFLRLVNEHYYDSTLFHRVIKDFMVQAGDPDSRHASSSAQLGAGGPGYTIDAEIVFPKHFHKRGALAAARQGDQVNPERRSSGSQFYIVTGTTLSDSVASRYMQQLHDATMQKAFNRMVMENRDRITAMQRAGDRIGLQALQDALISRAQAYADAHPQPFTDEMKAAYTTVGGAPHLDNDYTVFGEVTDGMDTIERIEAAETGAGDRPLTDIRILSTTVVG